MNGNYPRQGKEAFISQPKAISWEFSTSLEWVLHILYLHTPADVNMKLVRSDGISKEVHQTTFQSLIGSLLYASFCTLQDISNTVSISNFSANPDESNFTAAKRMLWSLKCTLGLCHIRCAIANAHFHTRLNCSRCAFYRTHEWE